MWVEPTSENAKRVHAALERFGAPLAELTVQDLASPGVVFQIGVAPRRIDILTSITGVGFAESWPDRSEAEYGGVRFPIIGRQALVRNKRALGRPKDLADLELLARTDRKA